MKRILVVDDHPPLRLALSCILTDSGYEVMEASDGAEAWQLCESSLPDVLITDLEMPEMDGEALIEKLKDRDLNLPVILMTGQKPSERFLRLLRFPRLMLLRKPVGDTVLLASIEQVLGLPRCKSSGRSSARIPLELDVVVEGKSKGVTRNISTVGAFIESPHAPDLGARISLELRSYPGPIMLVGTVARIEECGFGLRFDTFSGAGAELLSELMLQHLEFRHPLYVASAEVEG